MTPSKDFTKHLLKDELKGHFEMLPIAELEEGAIALLADNARHRRTRDRVVSAEVRAIRRRRGWTVVGSETR